MNPVTLFQFMCALLHSLANISSVVLQCDQTWYHKFSLALTQTYTVTQTQSYITLMPNTRMHCLYNKELWTFSSELMEE